MDYNFFQPRLLPSLLVGVTTYYKPSNHIIEDIGKHCYSDGGNGQSHGIIGDIINVSVGVKHERTDPHDERRLKNDYRVLISRIANVPLPQLDFLYKTQPTHILGTNNEELTIEECGDASRSSFSQ
ncbi:hypothetical protein CHS0354_020625 [Potamilus streckersoni]|uniref:Uncharacterized protein n=1 Tax=Potamilus streckersoni TaxID=2493646 RepID=A0AAE0SRD4_9BIVA|nr:hypothetical protein CHS0354_020625 [Potamilus streckersoni]